MAEIIIATLIYLSTILGGVPADKEANEVASEKNKTKTEKPAVKGEKPVNGTGGNGGWSDE